MSDTLNADQIIEKFNQAKEKKTRIEGSLESIRSRWKKERGFETLNAAKTEVKKLEGKLNKLSEREDSITEELNEVVDWDSI